MPVSRSRAAHLVPLAAVQAAGLVCGVIGVRWASAVVSPEVMGVYGLLVSTHLTASSVTHQGLIRHVQRHWTPQTPGADYLRIVGAGAMRPLTWLAGLLGVTLVILNVTNSGGISPGWWMWMLAVNLLVVGAQAAQAALQAEERYWANFVVALACSTTRSFLPPLLVMAGGSALVLLGAGFGLHALLWALAAAWFLRAAWRRRPAAAAAPLDGPERMIRAFVWVGLCGWVAGAAPRWLAALILAPEPTGHFMLAMNLSMIVPATVSMIGIGYSFPPLFAAARAGAGPAELQRMCDRTVAAVLVIGQAGLVALAWCGPHLVGLVVDQRYAPSMDWLLATGGAALAGVSGAFFSNLLVAMHRERDCLRLIAASAALRIALMAALVAAGDDGAFRLGLTLLPWPTAALELWIVRRWTRAGVGDDRPPTGSMPEIA